MHSILFILWLEPSVSMLSEKQGWSSNVCLKNAKSGSNISVAHSHYPISSNFSRVTLRLEVSSLSLLPDVFIHWMNCRFRVVDGSQMFRQALLVSVTILWSLAVGILGEGHLGSITFQLSGFPGSKSSTYSLAVFRGSFFVSALPLTIPTVPLLLQTSWSEKRQQSS